jgi:hypothetical protein
MTIILAIPPQGTGADTRRIFEAEIALEVGAAAFRPICSQALSEVEGHPRPAGTATTGFPEIR